jgi:hypothetical protein
MMVNGLESHHLLHSLPWHMVIDEDGVPILKPRKVEDGLEAKWSTLQISLPTRLSQRIQALGCVVEQGR